MQPEKRTNRRAARRAATAETAALFLALGIAATATEFAGAHLARAQQPAPRPHRSLLQRPLLSRVDSQTATAAGSVAAPDPLALLTRMVEAEKTIAYEAHEATFGVARSTEEIVKHDPAHGVRRETIKPQRGEVYVDDYHHAWILSMRNRKLTERTSLLGRTSDLTNGLGRIKRGKLKAEWVGVEQVAGRLADIVSVSPKDARADNGMSRRFWIDQQTGLRLRSEDRGPQGRILSSAYYLTINLSPSFKSNDFAPLTAPAGFTTITENRRSFRNYDEATKAGIVTHRPEFLPAGFRLRNVEVLDITSSGGAAPEQRITQRFDNGLTPLTLTQTGGDITLPKAMQKQLNSSTGAGFLQLPRGQRGYVWRSADHHATFLLIGSLPDDEFKRVADSVH